MEVIIVPTADDAAWLTSKVIAEALRENPHLTLGLATGRTMEPVYKYLVQMHVHEDLDFSLCRTFNLDEYVGLPPDHPQSYHYYMNQHLFRHINIDLRNTHLPNGMAEDLEAECQRYEELIRRAGGIDLQLLGIGRVGHIGFNEPLTSLMSRTHVQILSPETIEQNAPLFPDPSQIPHMALTMGVETILEARRCLLLATGLEKADIIAKAIEGPITAMISASALQLHPDCVVVLDEDAASKLQGRDYYKSIFAHAPHWEPFREALKDRLKSQGLTNHKI